MKNCRIFLSFILLLIFQNINAQVLKFDGVNDYVSINSAAGVNIRTIEFWFKLDNPVGPSVADHILLVGTDVPSPNVDEWTISLNAASPNLTAGAMRFKYVTSIGVVDQLSSDTVNWQGNRWYHIAVVIDPVQGIMMFVNGHLQSTINPNFVSSTGFSSTKVEIGRHGTNNPRYFTGEIDDVHFSSTANYHCDFTPKCPDLIARGSTIGLWNFNAGSGLIAADSSSNNYPGQIIGATWVNAIVCQDACPDPKGLTISAVGLNGVDLSWISGGANDWQIEYGLSGFSPGSGVLLNVSSNPFVISNLAFNTDYDFYVRDSCGPVEFSAWTCLESFKTSCDTFSASFVSVGNYLNYQFFASNPNSVVTWSWDFDDGSPVVTGQNPIHNFQMDGIYNVRLIMENACGDKDTAIIATSVCDTLIATFSSIRNFRSHQFDASNSISAINWTWDFGDASPIANGSTVSHLYQSDGIYNVRLMVENMCGDKDTIVISILACDTLASNFSSTRNYLNYQFDGSSSISATAWTWDFGDGSPSAIGSLATHTYQNDGIYDVSLITENICGDKDTLLIASPACDTLEAEIHYSSVDSNFTFQASGLISGAVNFTWFFGDGTQASGLMVNHIYSDTSNYLVSLLVENICGETDLVFITIVSCDSVHASWSRNLAGTTQNGMKVDFDASASINAVKYHWDFGDGNSKTVNFSATTHTYAVPSLLYVVCLTVENLCGDTDQSCRALNQIGLKELTLLNNNLKVYPNPANDFVNIEFEGVNDSFEILFYTVNAELISRTTVQCSDEGLSHKMDVGFLPKGIYLLQIPTSEGLLTRKIMIY